MSAAHTRAASVVARDAVTATAVVLGSIGAWRTTTARPSSAPSEGQQHRPLLSQCEPPIDRSGGVL